MRLLRTVDNGVQRQQLRRLKQEAGYFPAYLVGTICVHSVDKIPVLVFHVLEADIPQDTSVVEENIDAAKVLDRGFNDGFAVLNTVVVCYCLAASSSDFLNNHISGLGTTVGVSGDRQRHRGHVTSGTDLGRLALARVRTTEVVDNDISPP